MYKLRIAIKKELLILANDKAGLALMFLMPLLLVFIITIVQDSAFKIVNENKIPILLVNQDSGEASEQLIEMMQSAKLFSIVQDNKVETDNIPQVLHDEKYLTSLVIPANFSTQLSQKAAFLSNAMLEELGLGEPTEEQSINLPSLQFFHDPVLQENYCSSIINMVDAFVKTIEGELLIAHMCQELELEKAPEKLKAAMIENRVEINQIAATLSDNEILPTSTQHNVPAWTIFAMFFMVISLGNSIVKERLNGSFLRLKTMPTHFSVVLGAKLLVYLAAAILQVALIFSVAKLTFPAIGLPPLTMPENILAFVLVVLMSGLAAVSYATVVGAVARTPEQANGFGAVSIVILAAIGGIWVPNFIMPEFLQKLSYFSPLYWCLEGFYTLFLRGGNWATLLPVLSGLTIFSGVCLGITYFKLKSDKLI